MYKAVHLGRQLQLGLKWPCLYCLQCSAQEPSHYLPYYIRTCLLLFVPRSVWIYKSSPPPNPNFSQVICQRHLTPEFLLIIWRSFSLSSPLSSSWPLHTWLLSLNYFIPYLHCDSSGNKWYLIWNTYSGCAFLKATLVFGTCFENHMGTSF